MNRYILELKNGSEIEILFENAKAELFSNIFSNKKSIALAVKMPDGNIELIVNNNIAEKLKYIDKAYDDLRLKTCPDIQIVNFMLY